MSNMELWDKLKTTDPAHTKKFKRAGGFSGTSVRPIYMVSKMTEVFGPAGKGWGMTEPRFEVVPTGEHIMVYCTVSVWHGTQEQKVYGVGGDTVLGKNKYGPYVDDEAFKKAYTDAMSNAMKQIGMAADVHMGQHDDDKYVSSVKEQLHPTNGAVKVETSHVETWTGPLGKSALFKSLKNLETAFRKKWEDGDLDGFMQIKAKPEAKAVMEQAAKDMPLEWAGPVEDGMPYSEYFDQMERELKEAHPINAG